MRRSVEVGLVMAGDRDNVDHPTVGGGSAIAMRRTMAETFEEFR